MRKSHQRATQGAGAWAGSRAEGGGRTPGHGAAAPAAGLPTDRSELPAHGVPAQPRHTAPAAPQLCHAGVGKLLTLPGEAREVKSPRACRVNHPVFFAEHSTGDLPRLFSSESGVGRHGWGSCGRKDKPKQTVHEASWAELFGKCQIPQGLSLNLPHTAPPHHTPPKHKRGGLFG